MPLFTAENAAEMGKRGALARWAEPEPIATEPPKAEPIADLTPQEAELACVRDQLDNLNQQIKDCSDADTWDALTRSKERLFRIWARLAQLPSDPKPVTLKPAQSRPSTVQPIGPAPAVPGHVQAKPEQG